ncbi:MAG: phycobilisome linker polypeptide [Phormidium sp.]
MLGQTAIGSAANTPSGSRVFRYEVVGLHQNQETDKNNYSIRRSGSVFVTVPYSRMNEEMQRIARLGGKIVSIHPMGAEEAAAPETSKAE